MGEINIKVDLDLDPAKSGLRDFENDIQKTTSDIDRMAGKAGDSVKPGKFRGAVSSGFQSGGVGGAASAASTAMPAQIRAAIAAAKAVDYAAAAIGSEFDVASSVGAQKEAEGKSASRVAGLAGQAARAGIKFSDEDVNSALDMTFQQEKQAAVQEMRVLIKGWGSMLRQFSPNQTK